MGNITYDITPSNKILTHLQAIIRPYKPRTEQNLDAL